MTKKEIIEYLYENNVRGNLTIEQMADDLADTPQTETDFWASATRDDWLKAHGLDVDTPQTDCETCKHYNPHTEAIACERCLDGKYSRYEPQTDCGWK